MYLNNFFSRQPFGYPSGFSRKGACIFREGTSAIAGLAISPESFSSFVWKEHCQFDVFQRTKCSAFPRACRHGLATLFIKDGRCSNACNSRGERASTQAVALMFSVIRKHNVLLLPAVLKFTTRSIILYTSTRSTCYRRLCALSKDKQPICLPVSI